MDLKIFLVSTAMIIQFLNFEGKKKNNLALKDLIFSKIILTKRKLNNLLIFRYNCEQFGKNKEQLIFIYCTPWLLEKLYLLTLWINKFNLNKTLAWIVMHVASEATSAYTPIHTIRVSKHTFDATDNLM